MSDDVTCYLTEEDDPDDHDPERYGAVCGRCYSALSDVHRSDVDRLQATVADLSMLVRRLVAAKSINSIVKVQAMNYLRRKGLEGSPLREGEHGH